MKRICLEGLLVAREQCSQASGPRQYCQVGLLSTKVFISKRARFNSRTKMTAVIAMRKKRMQPGRLLGRLDREAGEKVS